MAERIGNDAFWQRLRQAPRISRWDWLWTLLPAALWGAGIFSRPLVMRLQCLLPQACDPSAINAVDRMSVNLEVSLADGLSYWIQNISIAAGLLVPLFLCWLTRGKRRQLLEDSVLWGQAALWNGVLMELARLVVQRPRPFVYKDPLTLGTEAAHYTSFYSGHTSFVAATWTALLLIAVSRRVQASLVLSLLALAQLLPALTAYFRVFSGRHFPSDTLFGWFAGVSVALSVAWLHRAPSPRH